jgi:hypothetical protein
MEHKRKGGGVFHHGVGRRQTLEEVWAPDDRGWLRTDTGGGTGDSRRKRTGVEHGGVGSGEASAQVWLPQRCGAGVGAGGSQSGGWGQQGSQSEFIFGGLSLAAESNS